MMTTASPAGTMPAAARHGGVLGFLFDHTIDEYPTGRKRVGYLAIAVAATVVLYYTYYTQTGVTPNILAYYHMTFLFYAGIVVVSNLIGAFASLPASRTDRIGRSNVVIYGVLAVGIIVTWGIPATHTEWTFAVMNCLLGLVEGAILVATPALVRDFSPQLGRGVAMGFWTIGPVAGSLLVSIVANHTLNHFVDWQSQFIISGLTAIGTFVVAMFTLKDLSPKLRDQLMVTMRDQALVEAKARGISEDQVLAATASPWRQIFKGDLLLSSLGISLFLLVYYAATAFFTIYYVVTFKNPNGLNFSVTQANGLNTWFWGADIIALVVVGLVSDRARVRKPFMLLGTLGAMAMLIVFLLQASHPFTGYYTLAVIAVFLAIFTATAFVPWLASYTENVESKNPALVGTGLALWGWVLRVVVGLSFLFLPIVINSANSIVNNQRYATPQIQQFLVQHPQSVAFAQQHAAFLQVLNEHPAQVNAVAADPSAANIVAVTKAIGPANFALLVKYQTQLKTLVVPYQSTLNQLAAHKTQLTALQNGLKAAPSQWQRWFWVDFAGMVLFIPVIFLTKGRWSPKKARQDTEAHEQAVADELTKLIGTPPPVAAPVAGSTA